MRKLALLLIASASAWLHAAEARQAASPRTDTFTSDSNLVLIPAVVLDAKDHFVEDLKPGAFEVQVDHHPVPIRALWQEDVSASVVIVFDSSGSMWEALPESRQALLALGRSAYPNDEFALIDCKDQPRLAVPFTSDFRTLLGTVARRPASGETALYDSIALAISTVKKGRNQRRVIIVISDGKENASRLRYSTLRHDVLESGAALYLLDLSQPPAARDADPDPSAAELAELAELSGGAAYTTIWPSDLPAIAEHLDLHLQYVLSFQPELETLDGKYHRVAVRLDRPAARGRRIYFRGGFYAKAR